MFNALIPTLSNDVHDGTIPNLAQPCKHVVVIDNYHKEAVLGQCVAHLATDRSWKLKRQDAFLRARPSSGSYGPVKPRYGLLLAPPECSDKHAPTCAGTDGRRRMRTSRGHDSPCATEIHLLLKPEIPAKTRTSDPVARTVR